MKINLQKNFPMFPNLKISEFFPNILQTNVTNFQNIFLSKNFPKFSKIFQKFI